MNESKRSDYFVQYVMGAEKKHPVIKRALDLVAARIVEDGGIDIARRGALSFWSNNSNREDGFLADSR